MHVTYSLPVFTFEFESNVLVLQKNLQPLLCKYSAGISVSLIY